MDILIRILMGIQGIVCILLIGIVLIQRSKGQGLGLSFGGGGAEAIFGSQMGNVLTKGTVILGIIFVANTTIMAVLNPTRSTKSAAERFAPATTRSSQMPVEQGVADDGANPLDVLMPIDEDFEDMETDAEVTTEEVALEISDTVEEATEAVAVAEADAEEAVVADAEEAAEAVQEEATE